MIDLYGREERQCVNELSSINRRIMRGIERRGEGEGEIEREGDRY